MKIVLIDLFLEFFTQEEKRWITWKNTGCKPPVPVTDPGKKPECPGTDLSFDGSCFADKLFAVVRKSDDVDAAASVLSPMDKLCALPRKDQYALSKFGATTPSVETFCADVLRTVDKDVMSAKAKKLVELVTCLFFFVFYLAMM
jgi:hypothetical protein